MSLAIGAPSSSRNMGFDDNKNNKEGEESSGVLGTLDEDGDGGVRIGRKMSESETSMYATDHEEEEDDENGSTNKLELGPQYTLKEQLEKDKDDESLRKWKEQLLGSVDLNNIGETLEPDVKFLNLSILSPVCNNIVSGLKYTNTVWKTGVKVDSTKEMLGTYSPQPEAYTHVNPAETTPSGMFARGSYSARSKFFDDDNKRYLEINYTFDIRKEWAAT
ncbi:RHO GDP-DISSOCIATION INHIBITOR [Salix purpurea]|uniref:RHO GDP-DISSOCIATION INHIBITOR n=1 Tax=Salix purpurea TaxID=77065 RepID=A0A9Q0SJY6_SALPP|nr:RHO GDP-DISSOCIATION INHIBITOR [Salix purpurea]